LILFDLVEVVIVCAQRTIGLFVGPTAHRGSPKMFDKSDSAPHEPIERNADFRKGLPYDMAFPQRTAFIERKVKFGSDVPGTRKLQKGTLIGQIADDTTNRRPGS
jgi:hypothetical protein